MTYRSIELSDETITLRPFRLENAEEHLAGEDAAQIRWLSGGKGTLEGVRRWIRTNQKYWESNGSIFCFAIFDPENDLVGMVEANADFREVDGLEEGDANISYGLYPQARGKGYATRAVFLMLPFLMEKGVKRAVIRVSPDNEDSLKVPLRCGFEAGHAITIRDNNLLIRFVKELW